MYGLRSSELSTCLFQFSHKTRQTMLLYAYFTTKVDFKRKFNHHQSFLYEWRLTARTIRNFESDHQYESNLESDVRFEIESNHEASQVPSIIIQWIVREQILTLSSAMLPFARAETIERPSMWLNTVNKTHQIVSYQYASRVSYLFVSTLIPLLLMSLTIHTPQNRPFDCKSNPIVNRVLEFKFLNLIHFTVCSIWCKMVTLATQPIHTVHEGRWMLCRLFMLWEFFELDHH